jgi:hypothetical protein
MRTPSVSFSKPATAASRLSSALSRKTRWDLRLILPCFSPVAVVPLHACRGARRACALHSGLAPLTWIMQGKRYQAQPACGSWIQEAG